MTDQPTITLAQWCAYLPYGITVQSDQIREGYQTKLVASNPTNSFNNGFTLSGVQEYNAKPLLRPMNKVNEEHINELLGAKFAFENGLLFDYNEGHWSGLKTNDLPYVIIQKLLAQHYDIFNLIPQGLALPIE